MIKKYSWLWFILKLLAIFAGYAVLLFIMVKSSDNVAMAVILLLLFILIIYFDNSCLTRKFRNKIPKKSILYRKKRYGLDDRTELYKTCAFLCLLLRFMIPFAEWLIMGLAILLPILTVIRYMKHSDKIMFSSKNKKYLSTTANTLLVQGLVLSLLGVSNQKYPIHFWVIWILMSLLFIVPFLVYTKEYKKNFNVALGFCACILLFMFGTVCIVNIQYDYSEPTEYRAVVTDKFITSGKTGSYYLVVDHGEKDLEDTYGVTPQEYRETELGDYVTVIKKDGFLKCEWHYLDVE